MGFKQETLHPASGILARAALSGALWIFCTAINVPPRAEDGPANGNPTQSVAPTLGDQTATLRLIAAPTLTNGRYRAGIDLVMERGAHTYWKQPGDAGVPPVFAFNGSENVAKAEVLFPTPKRIDEEGLEAFGYTDEIVFPVLVTPRDATRPSVLKLEATYAVCRKICMPGHTTATLALPPHGAGKVDVAKVEAALAAVPIPATPMLRQALTIEPAKGAAKPSWTLTWSGRTPVTDIFADAPEGFYFETKKVAPNRFTLTAAQVVSATKMTRVPVSLVLAMQPNGAVVHGVLVEETLDVPGSTN